MNHLALFREAITKLELHGFLVPMGDRFGSEYVAPADRRLGWLTGFTGSAGFAAVLQNKAGFFTDGRYLLQMKKEVDQKLFDCFDAAKIAPQDWLDQQAKTKLVIGYDPWLFTPKMLEPFEDINASLRPVRYNPIDELWEDRPAASEEPAFVHEKKYHGIEADRKINYVVEALKQKDATVALLCDSESINWLLNIRGHDLPTTPVIRAYAAVYRTGMVDPFVNRGQISREVQKHLGKKVQVCPLAEIEYTVKNWHHQRVMVDYSKVPMALIKLLGDNVILEGQDPCALPKASKNTVERDSIRRAHIRDGVAMVEFLHWLATRDQKKPLDELTVAEKLEDFRAAQDLYVHPSFETIVGFNADGAIIHYHATATTNQAIKGDGLLLIDSGGQYRDGTTDVTRTVLIGKPTKHQILHYTSVLKGHIALSSAIFPEGVTGHSLDAIARIPLWHYGLDYAHGTGHGVGMFLNVHEGPQNISRRANSTALCEGMVLSNEPGYYQEGAYGIRIENLIVVAKAKVFSEAQNFLRFETLTMVPYERELIEPRLLSGEELEWLNQYHAEVFETLRKHLTNEAREWLKNRCAPLS